MRFSGVYARMTTETHCEFDRCDYVCANGFSFTAIRVDESSVPDKAAAEVMRDNFDRQFNHAFILGVRRTAVGWSFYYPKKTVAFPREIQATNWDTLPWKRQMLSA